MSVLQPCDLADLQQFPAAVAKTSQMDDQVNGRSKLSADSRQGKVHPHQNHGLKAGQHVLRAVCVTAAQRSVMPRVHSLYHVDGLTSADLADDDPVRPHAQGRADQIPDTDGTASLYIRIPGLQAHKVINVPDLELSIVLDGNDPFISRYKFGEGIEEGGLSRSGPAADKNVVAGADNAVQKSSDLFRQGAQSQKILHPDRLLRKTPDRHDRTVQSHRRQNDIHTVSICKARIHDRRGFVDHAVTGGNYLLYYVLQLLL